MTKISWKVPYINLGAQYLENKEKIDEEFNRVMSSGSFILRDDVAIFEQNMADFIGVKHVIGVNSGTDALNFAARALGISFGDEVITVAHTFVATVAAIHHVGAKPVLVDIDHNYNIDDSIIENVITERTKAIMPVHMNGRMCDMDNIMRIADKHNLMVIEDAAQALGAQFKKRKSGSFGDIGCFSLHPMKMSSCPGDGGFISTNSDTLNDALRLLRNHGQKTKSDLGMFAFNSRLDNLQAAIVNVKFNSLCDKIKRRREIADLYQNGLSSQSIELPPTPRSGSSFHDVFSSYVIRVDDRDRLFDYLIESGIEVFIHMGKPLFNNINLGLDGTGLTKTAKYSKEILSLPIYPEMSDSDVCYVISTIDKFYQ